jgi:hypothetical protein
VIAEKKIVFIGSDRAAMVGLDWRGDLMHSCVQTPTEVVDALLETGVSGVQVVRGAKAEAGIQAVISLRVCEDAYRAAYVEMREAMS